MELDYFQYSNYYQVVGYIYNDDKELVRTKWFNKCKKEKEAVECCQRLRDKFYFTPL